MARVLPTALVIGVLAATAAAFALTERAKLALSPIYATQVTALFSPACASPCRLGTPAATVSFKLRVAEQVTVWIQRGNELVDTLAESKAFPRRRRLAFTWTGLTPAGTFVPDGAYRPYVKLERSHRTIALPNRIVLDTKAPVIAVKHPVYPIISPDGDGHADSVRIPYRLDKPAHAVLLVGQQRVVTTYRQPLRGTLVWDGKLGNPARAVPPGRYTLYVSAVDRAGNTAKPFPFAVVTVRYVSLGRSRIAVAPGRRFALRVSADAPHVRWLLHGRTGTARPGTLRIRAPKTPGTYRLYVEAAGHAARATVVVG